METIFEWFVFIAVAIVVMFMVYLYLVAFWCFIHCFKDKKFRKCSNGACKLREHCFRYEDVLTEEDIEELEKLIEQL